MISARIHPGESNSSFVMEGLIDYLLSDKANKLRDYISFKVILNKVKIFNIIIIDYF